jgi:hypothetical protein
MLFPQIGLSVISSFFIILVFLDTNILLTLLGHLENIGSLLLFVAVGGTLFWFAYWVLLRRVFRAWRIARIRSRRLLAEATRRGRE